MPAAHNFDLTVSADATRVEVRVSGELDLAVAPALEHQITQRLRSGRYAELTVDLADVQFMDAAGLGSLLAIRNAARRQGVLLRLRPGPSQVQRMFRLTSTAGLFLWERSL